MRYAGNYAKAQKREERAIFECYYKANAVARMDGHLKNLRLVRENLIEGDNDLTVSVWKNFVNTCQELRIDMDHMSNVVKIPEDPGKGNGYRIPSKEKDLMGHIRKKQHRLRWREQFRREFEELYGNPSFEPVPQERPQLHVVKSGVG